MVDKITLPDVVVTPDEKPPEAQTTRVLSPGGALVAPPSVPAHDVQGAARLFGYSWDDIHDNAREFNAAASNVGYTQREIDDYRGWPDPSPFHAEQDALWQGRLADDPKLADVFKPDAPTAALVTPDLKYDYAQALIDGHVKSATDFAQGAVNGLAGRVAAEGQAPPDKARVQQVASEVAKELPSHDQALDFAIGLTHAAGVPLTPVAVANTRANLLEAWIEPPGNTTPLPEVHAIAAADPLVREALTSPAVAERLSPLEQRAIMGDPEAFLAAQQSTAMEPFTTGLAEALGTTAAQIVGGIANALNPDEYMKSEARFLRGDMTRSEAAGFITLHLAGGIAPEGSLAAGIGRGPGRRKGEIKIPTYDETAATEGKAATEPLPPATAEGNAAETPASPAGGNSGATPAELAELSKGIATTVGGLGGKRLKREPTLPPPPDMEPVTPTRVEDDLNRLRTNATADKVELMQMAQKLPKEWRDTKFQEGVSGEIEQRMLPNSEPTTPETAAFLKAIKPLTDKQLALAQSIRAKLGDVAVDDPSIKATSVDEGYMHRVLADKPMPEGKLDPNVENGNVIAGTPRTLSKFASSLQPRSMYVWETADGERIFGQQPLDKMGKTFGDKDPVTGWTVKPATMAEVEANTDVRYQKNFLANTIEDVARLGRVDRNLDFLKTTAKEMADQGLFVARKPGESALMPPPSMARVELPQMDGWAEPKMANILNDFFNQSKGDLDGFLTRANRFLMSSLFISPVTHAGNVGAHWAVGRGWDWIKPSGYGSLMRDGARAVQEVWNLGPRYINNLREGSGLMYAGTATNDFYRVVMHKIFNEQLGDEATWGTYAKTLGLAGVRDLVKAEYKWSQRALWAVNDMFMLQRQFELERKGLATRDAIFQAEKDIPNYRVPSEVMGSHVLSEILRSPNWINFGRYKYGQVKAIGSMVKDMVGPNVTGQARIDAIGKATVMAAMATVAYPLINNGIQQLTGNPDASLRAFGPFALSNAIQGFYEGQKNWVSAVSSFMSLAPVIDLATKIKTNQDVFGRKIINPAHTGPEQVGDAMRAAIGQFYPGQLLLQTLKPGGTEASIGSLLGLSLPPVPQQRPAYERREENIYRRQMRKEWLDKLKTRKAAQ